MQSLRCPRLLCVSRPCRVVASRAQTEYKHPLDQAIAQSYSVAALDVDEYVSGKTFLTIPGRLVQGLFPAPLRFAACWIPSILAVASCHAAALMSGCASVASRIMAQAPMLQPLVRLGSEPIVSIVIMGLMSCLPIIFCFVALPLLDWILGEEDAQELGIPRSPWTYNAIFYVFAALHCTALLSTMYVASLPGTSALHVLLLCLNQGVAGAHAINTAHELTHRSNKADRLLGEALLTSCCYKHWLHSHRAHHAHVATDGDPASARYQESIYPFIVRCISGEWRDAVTLEMARMQKHFPNLNKMQQVLRSRIVGWIGWPLGTAAAALAIFGPAGMAAFLGASFASVLMLTTVNYVEHYGLTRKRLPSGQYEHVSIHHSWNANHLLSNASLLRLQRHTDHHMHGHKPFYQLRNVEGAPRLPADYSTMMLAALVPPLWFSIMNPRVQLYNLIAEVGIADARKGHAAATEAAQATG
eukprot:jgi/Ulvmu1/7651/UM038_0080.1